MKFRGLQHNQVAAISLFGVAIWVLAGYAAWRSIATGVRFGSPFTTHEYGHELLFSGHLQFAPILGVILLHICAAIVGFTFLVQPIWGSRRLAADVWLVLAGVVPGTLFFIVISRTITLFVTNAWAPAVSAALIFIATILALVRLNKQRELVFSRNLDWTAIAACCIALAATLVFSVHIDRFHVVGEASVWFMKNVYLSDDHGIGTLGHFPFISQHYDEAALLYPVIYGLVDRADAMSEFVAVYWIMIAIGRTATAALVYVAVRSLGADRLSSIVLLAFICGASLSLNLLSSHLLFDSLSPLAYALHIARILIPVLPFLLVAAFACWEGPANFGAVFVAVVLGIGFSSMPIHGVLVLPWGIGVTVLAAAMPTLARSKTAWAGGSIASIIVLCGCAFTYASGSLVADSIRISCLLISFLGAALVFLLACIASGEKFDLSAVKSAPAILLLAVSGGYVLGLLFLGNVFIPQTLKVLTNIWPWSVIEIAERGFRPIGISSWHLVQSPYCEEGYYWGFRTLTGHCGSLSMFVRSYGLAFAVIGAVVSWKSSDWIQDNPMPTRQLTWVLAALVLCILALPPSFAIYDFLSPLDSSIEWERSLSVWLRSRLAEPWFYGGILLALALFLREARTRERRWVQCILMIATAVFGLSPLVTPSQLIANFSYLFAGLLH